MSPSTRWRLDRYRLALIELRTIEAMAERNRIESIRWKNHECRGEPLLPRFSGSMAQRRKKALKLSLPLLRRELDDAIKRDAYWSRRRDGFNVERDRRDEAMEMSPVRA